MSAAAAARRRRHKADPYRAQVLAPLVVGPNVACARCSHPQLIHRESEQGRCLRVGCECTGYQEAS